MSQTSKEAINGSQLYAVNHIVNNLQASINNLENKTVNPDNVSDVVNNVISNNFKAGNNIIIDEATNPDDGSKTFTINAIQPNIEAGTGVTIDKNGDKITINAEGKTYTTGDNVMIGSDNKISANSTTVSSGVGITVTTTTNTLNNGATNINYEVALSDNLKAQIAKEESVSAGSQNVIVRQDGISDTGGKNFVVDIAKNVELDEVKLGDVLLTGNQIDMGGNVVSNIGTPITGTDAANKNYVDEVAQTLTQELAYASLNSQTDDGKVTNYKLGDTITVTGDGKNLSTATQDGKIQVKLADDVNLNSVIMGDVSISTKGVNAGGKKVMNIAQAMINADSTDAVTGSQLYATNVQVAKNTQSIARNTQDIAKLNGRINNLDSKVDKINKRLKAGIASSNAMAGLGQATLAGEKAVSVGFGTYSDKQALAVGVSQLSDNGKWLFKVSTATAVGNGKPDFSTSASATYKF